MDKYDTYAQLEKCETEDKDYAIVHRDLSSRIVVIAPHGGGIEPGTIDIADALAGCRYSFYGFKGLKKSGNSALHINSSNFDEPIAVKTLSVGHSKLQIGHFVAGFGIKYIGIFIK